jgi:hypothetical protein
MVLALAAPARAQALGQIFGVVTDSTGAVLPGVTVTVSGTGLQQPLTMQSTQTGAYRFPNVPIGTYTITFELSGFKKVSRPNITITTGFAAPVDQKMEIGGITESVTVTSESPLVDTKKTTTGNTFTGDIFLNIPTARDPWQMMNMTPGISLSGINVGGSASGQQPTISYAGTSANVQWNLEGGNITDMSSNSSPAYFNFDSFQEIQVITGGGDVSVQSGGVFINLVTKSGSNVFKGSATETFENHAMQNNNVSEKLFNQNAASGAVLSGAPLNRVGNYSGEMGGPIMKNRTWFWGGTDYQDINAGVVNYFKSDAACQAFRTTPATYSQLRQVQDCLNNDKTLIQDFNAKGNHQINSANKFQLLYQTDYKLRNNRGASSSTAPEATQSQYSAGVGRITNPTWQVTHTFLPTDKLVFTNQFTYLHGGFFLDNHDYPGCGSSTYARIVANNAPTSASCMYNIQPLQNVTTGYQSRAINGATYQTNRPSYELKTDGTYFVSKKLGGDHALKFGVGWRKNPVLTFTHTNGFANANMICNGNAASNCPVGDNIASNGGVSPYLGAGPIGAGPQGGGVGAPAGVVGLVVRNAQIWRDGLTNYDWQTTYGYLQDSYTRHRLTINGGLRFDYQWSLFLGGSLSDNLLAPDLLKGQSQGTADPKQPFHNVSPRVSATYDLSGKGTTAVHSSFSSYFNSKQVLANNLSNLGGLGRTFSNNQNNGACATAATASCWNDANNDGFIQRSELVNTPSTPANFDPITGTLTNVVPLIDPNIMIGRSREFIIGADHQVIANTHVTLDYIYRYNDRNQGSYLLPANGQMDQAAAIAQIVAAQALWQRVIYTDPQTGTSAPYYICPQATCDPAALGSIGILPIGGLGANGVSRTFTTNTNAYDTYKGIQLAVNKRLSQRWQGNLSYTWNHNVGFNPVGSYSRTGSQVGNPVGIEYSNGIATSSPRWIIKGYGSYQLPWYGLQAGMNMNIQDGSTRNLTISGPGTVVSTTTATSQTISYTTLSFDNNGTHHLPAAKLVDVNVRKTLKLTGRQELWLTFNAFNVFNISTIRGYTSSNTSNNGLPIVGGSGTASNSFNTINSIVPPRVFRIDATFRF